LMTRTPKLPKNLNFKRLTRPVSFFCLKDGSLY
jgi:hypothetical protein